MCDSGRVGHLSCWRPALSLRSVWRADPDGQYQHTLHSSESETAPLEKRSLGAGDGRGLCALIRVMPGSPTVLIRHRLEKTVNDYIWHCETRAALQYFSTHPLLVLFYNPTGMKRHLRSVLEVLNYFSKEKGFFALFRAPPIFTTPIIEIICHHYAYLALMSQCGMRGVVWLNHWCQRATKPGRCRATFSLFHMASMRQKRPLVLRVRSGAHSTLWFLALVAAVDEKANQFCFGQTKCSLGSNWQQTR